MEPAESSVLRGGPPGAHDIEAIGIGRTPPLWDPTIVDEVLAVGTEGAKSMARRLAREEALFAGTSSGANVVAAIEVAKRLGPGATVVDDRLRPEVPQHRRLPESMRRGPGTSQTAIRTR